MPPGPTASCSRSTSAPSNATVDPLLPVDCAEFAALMTAMDAVMRAVRREGPCEAASVG